MKKIHVLLVGILLLCISCSPIVTTKISKQYSPISYKEDIVVLSLKDAVPVKAEELGVVKIGDSGFTTDCGYDVVIAIAKLEARKAGGNLIKIIEHTPPSIFGSSCHRITVKIFKAENLSELVKTEEDTVLMNANYAVLNVYRYNGYGALMGYDLYLGDSVICRVKNNFKESIKIYKDGLNMLWARTESKEEVPINIKFGKTYYVRCGINMGVLVGRPKLEMVDKATARVELELIKK